MKNFFLLAILFVFTGYSTMAQDDEAWKYAQTITEQKLKNVLDVIASAQMQGRETGTEGQRRAASYIENQFKKIGLKAPESPGGYQQKYLLYRDSVTNEKVTIGGKPLQIGDDVILLAGSDLSGSVKGNQIVFAGYGIDDAAYSDYSGKNVRGKIVVVLNGEPKVNGNYIISGTDKNSPWSFGVNRKLAAAQKYGAIALVFINPGMDKFPSYLTNMAGRSNLYFPDPEAKSRIPVVYGLGSLLNNLFGDKKADQLISSYNNLAPFNKTILNERKEVAIEYAKKRFSVLASNVIGYVEGSDLKDQYVLVTGHYDHLGIRNGQIYYGADDDGSGTTAVIEMAAAMQQAKNEGHGPRRTVVFMTVSGEEEGLWGSKYYSENPVFPLDKTTVDLNTDMVGRLDPNRKTGDSTNYVYLIGNDKLSSDLDPISKEVNKKYLNLELDYKYNDPGDPERIYYRSDHFNFARKGVPVLFFFDGIHKDYHKPTDTMEKINFGPMMKRVRYTFLLAWNMANRNDMLKRDIPLPEMSR